jgi:hypothetical protein
MPKLALAIACLLYSLSSAFGQDINVEGRVQDTSENLFLTNASIVLLRKIDSVMIAATRADQTGRFAFTKIDSGEYVIMITYPGYADYLDEVRGKTDTSLGNIFMTLKSQLLQEVVVTRKLGAIRIKGDTIEYKADSFFTAPGATVESLLKKLPGIQVDKNGNISALGQTVQKLLIDGEEFFSDDPTIATRGLAADVVDKVQVYDKSSEQAEFTGVSDGKKTRTINLKLKEERKKGYFGKLEVGSDAGKFWNNNFMLNAFKGSRKLSAFGIMSSTGKTGLGLQETMDFAGGPSALMMSSPNEQKAGGDWGQGFPGAWTGGLHYSKRWKGDLMHLNAGYNYAKLTTRSNGNAKSQYILPDTLFFVNEEGSSYTRNDNHSVTGIFDMRVDSLLTVRLSADGSFGNAVMASSDFTESMEESGHIVNSSRSSTTTDGEKRKFGSSVLLMRKFRKKGRTFSAFFQQRYTRTVSSGYLQFDNRFYENQAPVDTQIVDQQKRNDNTTSIISTNLVYTEPLSRYSLLEFHYSLENSNRRSARSTLQKDLNDKYTEPVDSLSNDYRFSVLTNTAGVTYRLSKSKLSTLSFGMNVSQSEYFRNNLRTDSVIKYTFTNFFPGIHVTINIGQGGSLNFNYNGSSQAPSIEQVQPVKNNNDPLNISVGNPDLKQAFQHSVDFSLTSFKFLSERFVSVFTRFTTVHNGFTEYNTVDELGRRIYRPINVDGNRQVQAGIKTSWKVGKTGIRLGALMDVTQGRNINFINEVKNTSNSWVVSVGPTVNYDKDNRFTLQLTALGARNTAKSSVRQDVVTKYWTQSFEFNGTVFLPWKLELTNELQVLLRQKTDVFDKNNNVVRWDARLYRKILRNDAARIGIAAFDLLNQNSGFTRNMTSNFISERTYNNIRRYFMLSFLWNFKRN